MSTALFFALLITASLVAYHGFNLLTLVLAAVELRRQRSFNDRAVLTAVAESGRLPAVTAVIPAYNEQISIVRTVQSVLSLAYPDLRVIVVSDGSSDGT